MIHGTTSQNCVTDFSRRRWRRFIFGVTFAGVVAFTFVYPLNAQTRTIRFRWTASPTAEATYDFYRATQPSLCGKQATLLGQTTTVKFSDVVDVGVWFYSVGANLKSGQVACATTQQVCTVTKTAANCHLYRPASEPDNNGRTLDRMTGQPINSHVPLAVPPSHFVSATGSD
jgi:hypothetical protein